MIAKHLLFQKISQTVILYILLITTCVNLNVIFSYKYYETDFLVFYSATKLLVNNPKDLYIKEIQEDEEFRTLVNNGKHSHKLYGPFVNVPMVLLPFLPIISINPNLALKIAVAIWLLFSVLIIAVLGKIFVNKYWTNLRDLLFILNFTPLLIMVVATQTTLMFLLFLVAILAGLKSHNYLLAGFLAPFLWICPQLAPIITLWIIISWYRKILTSFLAGSAFFIGINLALTRGKIGNFSELFSWYSTHYEATLQKTFTMVSIQGFFAQFSEIFTPLKTYRISLILSAFVMVLCVHLIVYSAKKKIDPFKLITLVISGTLLAGMHVHWHSATILIVFYWYYYNRKTTLEFKILAMLGWLIFMLAFYSPFYPNPFYFIPTLYLLLLFLIGLKELRGKNFWIFLKQGNMGLGFSPAK
jgi:hypothetical protein